MISRLLKNKWIYIALAVILAAGLIFVLFFVVNWGLSDTRITELYTKGTFIDGIYINDINLSGKTMDEGREIAIREATNMLKSSSVRIKIGEKVYTLKGSDIGALVDYESVLKEAILTGRRGSRLSNSREVREVAENGRFFYLSMDIDRSVLESTLKEMSATFNTLPQDSMVAVKTTRTPSTYYINSTIEISDSVVGRTVDIEGLMNSIIKAVKNGDQNRIIVPDAEETLPENINLDELMEETTVISSTSISLEGLDGSQLFNIWRGSEMLTGTVIEPGESLSLSELFGDIENEGSWKYALMMTDKGQQQIIGGGIEYVASAFYQNALSSGLTVDEVAHHVVTPANIVDGLDAMVYRAEGKDLKVTNNFKFPVRIVANCDGGKKKNLEVIFYGGEPNYKFEVSTHMIREIEPVAEPETMVDETQGPDYEQWTEPRRNGKVVEVYRQRRDSKTGDLIGNQILVETVTYPEAAGKKVIGKAQEETPATPDAQTDPQPGDDGNTDGTNTQTETGEKTETDTGDDGKQNGDDKQENTAGNTENSAENKG